MRDIASVSHSGSKTNHVLASLATYLAVTLTLLTTGLLAFSGVLTQNVSATTNSGMQVGISEVLSLTIEAYDPNTSTYTSSPNLSMHIRPDNFGTASARITADTNAPYGYQLLIDNVNHNNALVEQHDDPSSPVDPIISSITNNVTINDPTDSTKVFPTNNWGYALVSDNNPTNAAPTIPLTYSPIPTTSTNITSTETKGTYTYDFTTGTRVDMSLPAGIYQDELMFTIIANAKPSTPSFYNVHYMQDFNQTVCNSVKTPTADIKEVTDKYGSNYADNGTNATIVPSTVLIDRRDNQEYTVRKLADGNCWMTENLRFGATLDNSPNPWSSTHFPADNTNTTAEGIAKLSDPDNGLIISHIITGNTDQKGADGSDAFGNTDEYYTKPYIAIYDANAIDDVSDTGTKFGALYNYCAASGGTACTPNSIAPTVSGSICPTNWTLPDFDAEIGAQSGTNASYNNLTAAYNIVAHTKEGVNSILTMPLSFPRAGVFRNGGLDARFFTSGYGLYWSSYPSSGANAYYLNFHSTANIYRDNYTRRDGRSVRCVVAGN